MAFHVTRSTFTAPTGVHVTLTDADGTVLEEGPAAPDAWRWRYDAQTDVPAAPDVTITAAATDRPGHTGSRSVEVTTP